MSKPLILAWPGNEAMASALTASLDAELGSIALRAFPDGETYLRLIADPAGRDVVAVCTLAWPNDKLLSLLFAADTARELGARRVGLVAPYLAYLRQDHRFKPGEAITSRTAARLISGAFDWLATVDPHLHRYDSLAAVYSIPTRVAHAAPLIADWLGRNVTDPLIIGPDSESRQWVAAVACDAPYAVLEKTRLGDREVEISVGGLARLDGRTPVLVDDIIASGRTMIQAVRLIRSRTPVTPVCIAVHGLFADRSDALLHEAGARVVTTNSVAHASNAIDVAPLLGEAVRAILTDAG